MWNTRQPLNKDVMTFCVQEGLKLSKPGGICAAMCKLLNFCHRYREYSAESGVHVDFGNCSSIVFNLLEIWQNQLRHCCLACLLGLDKV